MDEPFAGVDAATEKAIINIVFNLSACIYYGIQILYDTYSKIFAMYATNCYPCGCSDITHMQQMQDSFTIFFIEKVNYFSLVIFQKFRQIG